MPFSQKNVTSWVACSVFPKWGLGKEKGLKIVQFWDDFYFYAKGEISNQSSEETAANKRYKEGMIALLTEFCMNHRGVDNKVVADPEELYNLQLKIENMTMHFDEESMFHSTTNILKIIINPEKESARDFLRTKLTSEEDLALIAEFGQYTLEALIVHVLCVLFSSADANSMVRVASLVEQLEVNTRSHALIVRQRRTNTKRGEESLGQYQASGRKKR